MNRRCTLWVLARHDVLYRRIQVVRPQSEAMDEGVPFLSVAYRLILRQSPQILPGAIKVIALHHIDATQLEKGGFCED